MTAGLTNWAGNVTFSAQRLHRPVSVAEVQRLVAASEHVRAFGTGHSFNRIADSPGDLVSLAEIPPTMDIDSARWRVKVSAGIHYGELSGHLNSSGFALPNLASLPQISVAGACATGTHGSGDANGSLATAVSAMEMVTADGDLVTISRDADGGFHGDGFHEDGLQGGDFHGAVVGLGALGIVTSLTLDVIPAFEIRQVVYENLPREQVDDHFDLIFGGAYSVSLFTDWRGPRFNQLWLKHRAGEYSDRKPQQEFLGARLADGPRHPVRGMPPAYATQQMGVPGPWHERLPHFRPEFTPSAGTELQSEYLLPRAHATEAIAALDQIRDSVASVLQISEIRTIAPDDLWLSPSYQRETVGFHFTWIEDIRAVVPAITAVEERLAPFHARPHWGKLFATSPGTLCGLYERLPDFQRLMRRYDPAGKFRNEFIDRHVAADR
ncbi:MAG: D-arabinono-1,4-lactone oxidase [Micromonosporaceae bacterium]